MKKTHDINAPETPQKPMKKSKAALILSIISVVFLALTVLGIILFQSYLSDVEYLREVVGKHYILAALVCILICAVQVVVALIPGEIVEIAAGYIFGAWWGSLLCLVGIVLGSACVLLLVRKFGCKFVYTFYPKEKIDKIPILNHPRKRNILVLVLFSIPGTPKDMLTYAIGLTDMSIPLYILLTTAARFPSVISSTLGGDSLGERQYITAIVVFVVTILLSSIGVLVYNHIQKKHEKKD